MVKLLSAAFAAFLLMPFAALNGQIKVFDNGNVGIKYTTSTPLSKLVLNAQGYATYDAHFYTSSRSSSGGTFYTLIEPGTGTGLNIISTLGQAKLGANNYLVGVKGAVTNTTALTVGRSYGIYGIAGNASSGYNYGVYGYLYGSNNGAAVFGTSSGDIQVPGKYAGYFYGNVQITGTLNGYPVYTSDEKIKKNITALTSSETTQKISLLRPIKFNLKQREIVSADSSVVKNYYDPDSELFKKPKYGFIAQEVRDIFPDLVYEGDDNLLAIDYVGLIPIMVVTIQEQQKKIQGMEADLNELKKKVEELFSSR